MLIKELLKQINQEIPLQTAEEWDNVGLLIGDEEAVITGILTALDCTLDVVEEAKEKNINTIICHHPLIFSGIKSILHSGYGEVIRSLIKNDIQLIALHTNLDAHPKGVSAMIAERLELKDIEILLPEQKSILKLQIFVPLAYAEQFKSALAKVGAGQIGDYDHCFFSIKGTGEFRALENANPFVGSKGEIHVEEEMKIECVFESSLKSDVLEAIKTHHPYETPAFDIWSIDVQAEYGTGVKAALMEPISLSDFAKIAKEKLNLDVIKMIGEDKVINTVGIIGGAGMDYMKDIKRTGVDVFITGDIKYHEAHDLIMAELAALDITHYAEYVMKDGLKALLSTFIKDINIVVSQIDTNPFKVI
ncbi:Nif3-like dinuclear metal center hexameric protein [Macrococcoides goetzii]|uniref:Nif3-like dinuclear metal center hexameric protein n=1 Tax=Macrococcus sp. PK TaxID=2801919 RepID=UPI001F0EE232|nr:Nif3-like dinuclear metal center hexameric protein [Macrococcus sp. PK]MCH4984194.1 Nif3-like dinuclear metal center hexameric protein [Macrococcus sp. PK]